MTWYGQSIHNGGGCAVALDSFLYEQYFRGKTDGFYIEAGAHDGAYLSTCKAFEEMGWRGLNVEPSNMLYPKLCENRPRSINLQIALSDKDGIADFECTYYDNGSFSHMAEVAVGADVPTIQRHSVTTKTYKTLVKENNVVNVDLFVLDVEGHELKALAGMGNTAILPKVICVEHVYAGLQNIKNIIPKYNCVYTDPQNAVFII